MEFFVVGMFCFILGFMVSWFTDVDFRSLACYILLLPFIVVVVAGLSHIKTIYPPTLGLVTFDISGAITSHFVEYLLYSLGGYTAGAFMGFLTPGHS